MSLTHIDDDGLITMVDVGHKPVTSRTATARGRISMCPAAYAALRQGTLKKGDALATARVAAIMAVKKTAETIPLCHPLPVSAIEVDLNLDDAACAVEAHVTVGVAGQTGVEMEALHGVSVALLTIYDMVKAMDKSMVMSDICLLSKKGGKSGTYRRED